jgi:hypothetical protein
MLFQQDYWRMSDEELEKEAWSYHIGAAIAGPHPSFDRQYAITCLLARDQAMRTGITVVSTIVSVLMTVVNVGLVILGT